MRLPQPLLDGLEAEFGNITDVSAVSGGCISRAARLETRAGPVFLKFGADSPAGLFRSEAHGLRELRSGAGDDLKIPEVLALGDQEGAAFRWLVLEWLETGKAGWEQARGLGTGLARLHGHRGDGWGDRQDGFIGSLPQDNARCESWADFWARRRLIPQLERCGWGGGGTRDRWEALLDRLPSMLEVAEEEGPAPLHGDLWGGNVIPLADGRTALIDPSFHHGHREVDLAMADLFGGLTILAREAYLEALPLAPGYEEVRRGVYQLYYLLVHVNLFGGGYAVQTESVLDQVLAT